MNEILEAMGLELAEIDIRLELILKTTHQIEVAGEATISREIILRLYSLLRSAERIVPNTESKH